MVPLERRRSRAQPSPPGRRCRQAHDGLWLWRDARGYTKRANSIHCLDPIATATMPSCG